MLGNYRCSQLHAFDFAFFVHVVLHQALTKKLERIFQFHFLRKRYMFTVTSAYSTYISKQGRVLPVASRCCKEKCIPLIVFSESSQRKGDPGFKLTDFNLWIYKISNSLVYKKGKHACHQPSNLNHKLGFTDLFVHNFVFLRFEKRKQRKFECDKQNQTQNPSCKLQNGKLLKPKLCILHVP